VTSWFTVRPFLSDRPDAAVADIPAGWPGPGDARTADGFLRLYPHRHGTDAFFAALLRRQG
jgi:16S rRNA (cytosine967-C5)-methyltransferase